MPRWKVDFRRAQGAPAPCRRGAPALVYIFKQVSPSDMHSASAIIAGLNTALAETSAALHHGKRQGPTKR